MLQKIFPFLLFALTLSPSLFCESLSLDDITTEDEQMKMGLNKLTAPERDAFEAWLGKWTLSVIKNAPSHQTGESFATWLQKWPKGTSPIKKTESHANIEARLEYNKVIFKVSGDGKTIELKDGSVWKVADYETYKTRKWQRDDPISIEKTAYTFPPYILTNNAVHQYSSWATQKTADCEMIRPPSEQATPPPEKKSYYEGAKTVKSVSYNGDLVTLSNNASYDITPVDQLKTRNWKSNDRISVANSNDVMFPITLKNLDSGEDVGAILHGTYR